MRRLTIVVALSLVAPAAGCAWVKSTFGPKPAAPAEPSPEERRQAYVQAHPDLDDAHKQAILEGALAEGMTGEDVKASLGRPMSMGVLMPADPQTGDEEWLFEEVAYGTRTDFEPNGPRESRIFSGVRDTRVRFWEGKVVGVDDLGYATRDDILAKCNAGYGEACDRVSKLDDRAESMPPPSKDG